MKIADHGFVQLAVMLTYALSVSTLQADDRRAPQDSGTQKQTQRSYAANWSSLRRHDPPDWPAEMIRIRTLGEQGKLQPGAIRSVTLLGSDEKLDWQQNADALVVRTPTRRPCDFAYCLRIERE